ncbi:hypothetical protein U5M74_15505 [Puerhibacterium sp. TATVAM-FAB25]
MSRDRIRRLVRAGELVQVARGVYDVVGLRPPGGDAGADRERERTARLGVLAHGPTAVAAGHSALTLWGVHGVPRTFRPEIVLRGGGAVAGPTLVRVRREPVTRYVHRRGVPCLLPEVALAQAVGEVDRLTAVALMDSARHQRILTDRAFARARELARHRRGAARSRRWWDESEPRAESPAETWARLRCADAGVPPDRLQPAVYDASGRFLARVDLAWYLGAGAWLLGEVDGANWHGTRKAVVADMHRQNAIVTSATVLRRWTGTQAGNGSLVSDVRPLLTRAGWRPGRACPDRVVVPDRIPSGFVAPSAASRDEP